MRFLLADDHGLFRDSMAVWLKQLDNNLGIDFADDFNSTQQAIDNNRYDFILLDLGMPGMQGTLSIRHFCSLCEKTPLMIVSADENPLTIAACLEAGARGYVTKSSDGQTILQAIRHVMAGMRYLPAGIDSLKLPRLSDRQLQILALLAEGLSNRAISDELHLAEGTVKQYVSQLLKELDVDNRTQAAKKAGELLGIL
ncbi:MAG TPA: response regulator transcription factor [Gammaproteobacteria bacterium]|nr:response regulator transcription factor [Gammaproteobacteria bacterium]